MPVTLTIEDGTNVPNANSFVDIDEYKEYADQRGFVIPTDDEVLKRQLIRATDVLKSLEPYYAGTRTFEDQALPFPRERVPVPGRPGYAYGENDIPTYLKEGQIQYALAIQNGFDPNAFTISANGAVKRKKIGPIETEYFEGTTSETGAQAITAAYNSVSMLFAYRGMGLRTMRV